MFQKIAKHRANDASNDVHGPPLLVTETSVNSEAAKLMKPIFGKILKTRLTHHCVYPCITEGVIFDVPKNVHH